MGSGSLNIGVVGMLIMGALLDPKGVELSQNEAASVQAGIEAGLEDWQSHVSFRSSFTVEFGKVAPYDFSQPEKAGFDSNVETIKAHGVLNKRGKLSRCQYEFAKSFVPVDEPPIKDVSKRGRRSFRFTPRDEASSGDVSIMYIKGLEKGPESFFNEVVLAARTPERRNTPIPSPTQWIDPVSLGVLHVHDLFELPNTAADTRGVVRRVFTGAEGRITVLLEAGNGGTNESRELTFRITGSTPLLERRSDKRETAEYSTEDQVLFVDYQRCDGGFVASKVIEAVRTRFTRSKTEAFGLTKWASADLGKSSPVDEDFVVTVPESATVIGTNNLPAAVNGQRRFDITKFPEAAVSPAVKPPVRPVAETGRMSWMPFVVLNIALIVVFALVFWARRRRRPTTTLLPPLSLLLCVVSLIGCGKSEPPGMGDGSIVVCASKGPLFLGPDGLTVEEVFSFENPSSEMLELKTAHKSCTCLDYEILTPNVPAHGIGKALLRMQLQPLSSTKGAGLDLITGRADYPRICLKLTCRAYPRLSYRSEDTAPIVVSPDTHGVFTMTAITNQPGSDQPIEFRAFTQNADRNVALAVGQCREDLQEGVRHCERTVQATLTLPSDESQGTTAINQAGYSANIVLCSGADRITVPIYWRAVRHIAVEPSVVLLTTTGTASEPSHMVHLRGDRAFRIREAKSASVGINMEIDYSECGLEHDIRITVQQSAERLTRFRRSPIEIVTDHPQQPRATLTVLQMPN